MGEYNLNFKVVLLAVSLLLSGCSVLHKSDNSFSEPNNIEDRYSLTDSKELYDNYSNNEFSILLAFSGGGARASALSYGVLEELKNTTVEINGEKHSLEDQIEIISSVSGGSFTSAYYGLNKESFYTDFKTDFLYKNVSDDLFSLIMNPVNIFSNVSRVDRAKYYYKEHLFGNATFKDLNKEGNPFIIINASDISTGLRFSFTQEYFDLICSDVNNYPIASAVTASAAVPVLFEPIVIDNYSNCVQSNDFNKYSKEDLTPQAKETLKSANAYLDKDSNKYIHLVDGGITDNLGLLAFNDLMKLHEIKNDKSKVKTNFDNKKILVIVVDASTNPDLKIGETAERPSLVQTLNVVTDIQLHRYNHATKEKFRASLENWENNLENKGQNVDTYFVDINFKNVIDEKKKFFFNQAPTDMSLEKETIDLIIEEAKRQLSSNKEYNKLLREFE